MGGGGSAGRAKASSAADTALRQLPIPYRQQKNWTAWTASYVIVGVGSLADGHTVAMPDCINNELSGQGKQENKLQSDRGRLVSVNSCQAALGRSTVGFERKDNAMGTVIAVCGRG